MGHTVLVGSDPRLYVPDLAMQSAILSQHHMCIAWNHIRDQAAAKVLRLEADVKSIFLSYTVILSYEYTVETDMCSLCMW